MKKNINFQNYISFFAGLLVLTGLDQWTKYLASTYLKGREAKPFIPHVMELRYLENRGAAFGMMQNQKWFFVLITLVFMGILLYAVGHLSRSKKYLPLHILAFVLGSGALGNFIDRIRLNYVVDFFCTTFIDFPIFNVADIYVTVGFPVLILLIMFYYKEDDMILK